MDEAAKKMAEERIARLTPVEVNIMALVAQGVSDAETGKHVFSLQL